MPEATQFGDLDGGGQPTGTLKPNTVLLARYKIDSVLGGGGQGAVYRARDLNFPDARRLVAVKEMHVSTSDPNRNAAMKTFQREANILATLAHPAIPKIYDFFDQNSRAYLVMEYINGTDLEALLSKVKSLPMVKVLEWAVELCDVLQYLHSYQPEPIIFRDMKPANVMADSLGKVRLIDFGIAKVFTSGAKHTTIGTEGYSAPEQYRGNANPLSDIYSLGATLHHVITRQDPRLAPPFSFAERPMRDFNEEVTAAINHVVEKALAFESKDRWQSAELMKQAIEDIRYSRNGPAVQTYNTNQPYTAAPATPAAMPTDGTSLFPAGSTSSIGSTIQPAWVFKAEDEIRGTPAFYNDTVYFGSYDHNLYAIRAADGSFLWKRSTEEGIAASPAINPDAKQILIGSEDKTFIAVGAKDGAIAWSHTTGDKIRASARVAHGYAFFGSDDGKFYALIAAQGRLMWEFDAGSPIRNAALVTNDRIIFGTDNGEVFGLELNGTRKWVTRSIKKPIISAPAIDTEGICYVTGMDNYIYALDADSGTSTWKMRTGGPLISSPVVDRNYVYFGSTDGKLYCVNTQTGKERWSFDAHKPITSTPAVNEGIVYFGGQDYFYALNAKDGKEVWKFPLTKPISGAPCITNNLILFGSLDYRLYALPLVPA